jgi:CBS domain containing-hemolysin-like protein
MTLLIFYLLLAIVISFLCSILEAVLLSITPSYIGSLNSQGKKELSQELAVLKDDIDKPLAAILSFNTIAHTVGAAGVGAQAAKVWGDQFLVATSVILTLLILVFSEIIPKTIGANYWRSLTGFAAKTLKVLIILMYPLVILSKLITKLLSKKGNESSISRAEVSAMADIGHREGIFKEGESKMLKNMIMFRNIRAEDIMTPRTVIMMVQQELSVNALYKHENFSKFSRFPVFKENRDDITGYVHKNDVLTQLAEKQPNATLESIKRKIIMVSSEITLPVLLDKFLESKEHIALATDRYGGVSGLVTMEDIMETVLGEEIVDEYDSEADMQAYARERWKQRAMDLGIINQEDNSPSKSPKENIVKYGITGGQPPSDEDEKAESGK